MTTGHRYGGHDAQHAGIADRAVTEDEVRSAALEAAAALTGKAGPTLGTIKSGMYAPVLAALRDPAASLGQGA